jgi:hypothetical protein
MPKLPTVQDFGAGPAIQVNRNYTQPAAVGDLTQGTMNLARAGSAVQEIGGAISQMEEKLTTARRAAQLNDAVGKATEELGRMEIQYGQDQDFKTAPDRFVKDTESLKKKYADMIDDPVVKQSFDQHYNTLATTKRLNVLKQAVAQEGEYHVNSLNSNLDIYAKSAATATDDATRNMMFAQAEVSITAMQQAGWINRIDAGNRLRKFGADVDEAKVKADLFKDPSGTAFELGRNPEYAANLDPIKRQQLIETGWNRQQEEDMRQRTEATRLREAQRDEIMKQAWDMDAQGKVIPKNFIEKVRPLVTDGEYHSLLKQRENNITGENKKSSPDAMLAVERALDDDPQTAGTLMERLFQQGKLSNGDFKSYRDKARGITRRELPKSGYERGKEYLQRALRPGEGVYDPAASTRWAEALREYDSFATGDAKRTDQDFEKQSQALFKKWAILDAVEIARKTSMGQRGAAPRGEDPKANLENLKEMARKLISDRQANKISQEQYNRRMRELSETRKAWEKAHGNGK